MSPSIKRSYQGTRQADLLSWALQHCRTLVAEVGVDLEARGTALIDHTDYVKTSGGGHTVSASVRLVNSTAILGGHADRASVGHLHIAAFWGCLPVSQAFYAALHLMCNAVPQAPVLFKGVAATVSAESTTVSCPMEASWDARSMPHAACPLCLRPLAACVHGTARVTELFCCMDAGAQATVVLSAADTAFSAPAGNPVTDTPLVASGHAALVVAVQARLSIAPVALPRHSVFWACSKCDIGTKACRDPTHMPERGAMPGSPAPALRHRQEQ